MIQRVAAVLGALGLLLSPLYSPATAYAAPVAPTFATLQQANGGSALALVGAPIHASPAENGPDRVKLGNIAPLQQDTTPPTVLSVEPADGSIDVAVESGVVVNFSEPIAFASFEDGFTLVGPGNTPVASAVSWDSANNSAILTPTLLLASGTVYTATLTGDAADAAGNTLGADLVWHFTTGIDVARSIWGNTVVPAADLVVETEDLELGHMFRSSAPGYITHIRLYRHEAGSAFTVSLWTGDGATLLSRTTSPPLAAGWQEVALPAPVEIAANTNYMAAYMIPVGISFAASLNYFTEDIVNPPLTLPGGNGQNGYYHGPLNFPSLLYFDGNWWIDVVFEPLEVDTVAPTVHSRMPEPSSVNIDIATNVTVRFDEAMDPGTITTASFRLRADGASLDVPATVSYNASTHSATLNPTVDLASATLFHVTVAGTVADVAGNPLGTADTWSFTTGSPATRATLWASGDGPTGGTFLEAVDVELGTLFYSDAPGTIAGVRFYRQSTGGAFVVSLWSGDGALLATSISPDVTATGWQEAHLTTPVAILADTNYVVSYRVPAGIPFSYNAGYFTTDRVNPPLTAPGAGQNGLFAAGGIFPNETESSINFWVDPVLHPLDEDTTPPTILTRLPAASATDVALATDISIQFSEAMDAGTISATSVTLRADGASEDVAATVTYTPGTWTATLNPASDLEPETLYNVTVAGSVADTSGNTLGSNDTWQFTTQMVPLNIAWNMLSVPNDLGENATIADAFASIDGQYALVYAYHGCSDPGDPWRTYNPADPGGSDLQIHDPMAGYWVFLTEGVQLDLQGASFPALAVDLCAGWNLVGVPFSQATPIDEAIASCNESVKMVYTFDLTAEGGPWLKHRPGGLVNDFHTFEPGKAYWVYSTTACTLGTE